jgi:PRTRC genetic system protein A
MKEIFEKFDASNNQNVKAIGDTLSSFSRDVAAELERLITRPIAAAEGDENLALDVALYDSAPTVVVPAHAKFAPLVDIGHRFLMAAEGVFVEVRRPWLHVIQQIAKHGSTGPRPPCGTVEPKVELAFGKLGVAIPFIQAFAEEARTALPNEHAAWIVWDQERKALAYRPLRVSSATPGAITFERPALPANESLVIDIHSHGAGAAFFSNQDDADDAGEVKISAVLGGLADGGTPSVAFRLCVLGMFIPLKVPAEAVFNVAEPA